MQYDKYRIICYADRGNQARSVFRVDNFKDEKWYGDLKMFLSIGICATTKRKSEEMKKALKVLGYSSHTQEKDGKLFLLPGAERPRTPTKDYER